MDHFRSTDPLTNTGLPRQITEALARQGIAALGQLVDSEEKNWDLPEGDRAMLRLWLDKLLGGSADQGYLDWGVALPCRKGRLDWSLNPEGHLTISGTGTMADYTDCHLPPWTDYAREIRMVTLEEGVKNLGARAFRGYPSLTQVRLSGSVTYLGTKALENCAALAVLESPRPLRHYHQEPQRQDCLRFGTHALRGTALAHQRWGDFYCCNGVVLDYLGPGGAVTIPDGIRAIGDGAFQGIAVTEIRFPASVEYLGICAFRATALQALELPGTLRQVESHAFANTPVREVRLGAQRIRIHPKAFQGTPVAGVARKFDGKWPQRHTLQEYRVPGLCPAQALRTTQICPFGTDYFNSKGALERHLRLGNQVIRLRVDRKRKLVLEVQSMALNHLCEFYTAFFWPCQGPDGSRAIWKQAVFDHTGNYLRRYSTRELRPYAGPGNWEWFTMPRLQRGADSPLPLELLDQWLTLHPDYRLPTAEEQAANPAHNTNPR